MEDGGRTDLTGWFRGQPSLVTTAWLPELVELVIDRLIYHLVVTGPKKKSRAHTRSEKRVVYMLYSLTYLCLTSFGWYPSGQTENLRFLKLSFQDLCLEPKWTSSTLGQSENFCGPVVWWVWWNPTVVSIVWIIWDLTSIRGHGFQRFLKLLPLLWGMKCSNLTGRLNHQLERQLKIQWMSKEENYIPNFKQEIRSYITHLKSW